MRHWRRWVFALAAAFILAVLWFNPGARDLRDRRRRMRELQERNQALEAQRERLREELRRVRTDTARREQEIRLRTGWLGVDEMEYRILRSTP